MSWPGSAFEILHKHLPSKGEMNALSVIAKMNSELDNVKRVLLGTGLVQRKA